MARTGGITTSVTLPEDLVAALDDARAETGQSRHAMMLRLLRAALSDAEGLRQEVRDQVLAELRADLARRLEGLLPE